MTASLICSRCSLSRWPIINKTTMQLRRLFKVQWPINKLITKRAMVVITKCNRLFHYRVQWQVIRPAILFLSEMTCYYKVYLYKVRWPVIAKLDSYFTTKFNVHFSTNWTIQTGHPDYSTILAKRFQETFPFCC